MNIHLAEHFGMCFGVKAALRSINEIETSGGVTVLGELVHNPVVQKQLVEQGIKYGSPEKIGEAESGTVVFTAHGVSDNTRRGWSETSLQVVDTTCPLVKKAHRSLECLVLAGYLPVVIGQRDHVEVRGLTGDFPEAIVVLEASDIDAIPEGVEKIGIISQTTQPVKRVQGLVDEIAKRFHGAEVRFVNTVCQPTRDRQQAMEDLCRKCDTVVVVGGRNSNNTKQLVESSRARGCDTIHVVEPGELFKDRFANSRNVGVTAGTSTLDETVEEVVETLRGFTVSSSVLATELSS